jgi:hypothetical protein
VFIEILRGPTQGKITANLFVNPPICFQAVKEQKRVKSPAKVSGFGMARAEFGHLALSLRQPAISERQDQGSLKADG